MELEALIQRRKEVDYLVPFSEVRRRRISAVVK
jgi:hypothetical protein